MAAIKNTYSAASDLTITLNSLSNAASATSATVDNSTTRYLDVLLEITVTTLAQATVSGIVEIYAKGSIDNADFDDDVNDKWIGAISMAAAGAQTRKRIVSVAAGFGGAMPPYWQVRIRNATGGGLNSSTGGTISWVGVAAEAV